MKHYVWCLLLPVLAWSCGPEFTEEEMIESVRAELDARNMDGALVKVKDLLHDYPKSTDGNNMLGYIYQQQGQLDRADSALNVAIQLDTTNSRAWFNMANVKMLKAEQSKEPADFLTAAYHYQKVTTLNPDLIIPYLNQAVMLNNITGFYDAIWVLQRALEIDPNNARAHYLMGRSYQNLSNEDGYFLVDTINTVFTPEMKAAYRDTALTVLEKAVALGTEEPLYNEICFWAGNVNAETGNDDRACELWTLAYEAGSELAFPSLIINCADFDGGMTPAEKDAYKDSIMAARVEYEEGHFEGDGHNH